MRYVKDPATGNRVSRMNPETDWIIKDVPELRIVEGAFWKRVKERQEALDATPRVKGIKEGRFRNTRHGLHLLTGKLVCGSCGGTVTAVGRDYLACSNARKLRTVNNADPTSVVSWKTRF
ncbi:zinc ribbon domain-containing protein [Thalassococcus profundi]